jgi:hypothetical protein
VTRDDFAELVYRYGEACEQAQLTGADHKQAEGRVLAAFDALQAEATISYEALERQREATKAAEAEIHAWRDTSECSTYVELATKMNAAEAEVEALRAEVDDSQSMAHSNMLRALAAESSLAEVTRERDEEAANSRSKRLVVQSLREQLVTLESSLAEAVDSLEWIAAHGERFGKEANVTAMADKARAVLAKIGAKP